MPSLTLAFASGELGSGEPINKTKSRVINRTDPDERGLVGGSNNSATKSRAI